MSVYQEIIPLGSSQRNEFVDLTGSVQEIVTASGIKDGVCHVFCPHTTAGLTINENADPDVKTDLLAGLEKIIPNIRFKHMEGNSDAHLKASLMGFSLQVMVQNRKLLLGTWQDLYFCEFDGPRHRKVHVQVMGE